MPIYSFQCQQCGNYTEIYRPMADAGRPKVCSNCEIPMNRIFNAPQVVTPMKTYYNHGLGCVVNSKQDIKDALRRINDNTGQNLQEVGNENIKPKQPKTTDYKEILRQKADSFYK